MSKFDPLEEAKITDDKSEDKGLSKKKKKAAAKAEKAAAAAPEEPPAPPLPPTPAERAERAAAKPAPAKTVAAEPRVIASPDKKYRVLEDKMASVRGRMTKMRKGKILEARFYGGVLLLQRILDSGVKVEEC